MSAAATRQLLERYYAAFNAGDWNTFLGLLTDDVIHDVNQSGREVGREAFKAFMQRMNTSYSEQIADIVIMAGEDGSRAAVEFTVLGTYLKTDEGHRAEVQAARRRLLRHPGWPCGARHQLLQPAGLAEAGRRLSELRTELLRGERIRDRLDALADLRIAVFRDWPYLYEGSRQYEAHYLDVYLRSPRSLAILVWDGDACIGASTVLPLADAGAEAQQPFRDGGHQIEAIDYFGESVLLRPYRGRGLGVKFFELREAHAREQGLSLCAFCSVDRPADDPRRPADYVPNDRFWTQRGYRKAPEIVTSFSWPDIGHSESTAKPMTFWLRRLEPSSAELGP